MDACIEVDGRVGERRGYIYLRVTVCVSSEGAVPYFILLVE